MSSSSRCSFPAWLLFGLRIPRAIGPLIVLMLLFLAGGLLAATQAKDFSSAADLLRRHRLPRPQLLLLRLLDRGGPRRARHDRQRLDRRRVLTDNSRRRSAISG